MAGSLRGGVRAVRGPCTPLFRPETHPRHRALNGTYRHAPEIRQREEETERVLITRWLLQPLFSSCDRDARWSTKESANISSEERLRSVSSDKKADLRGVRGILDCWGRHGFRYLLAEPTVEQIALGVRPLHWMRGTLEVAKLRLMGEQQYWPHWPCCQCALIL